MKITIVLGKHVYGICVCVYVCIDVHVLMILKAAVSQQLHFTFVRLAPL